MEHINKIREILKPYFDCDSRRLDFISKFAASLIRARTVVLSYPSLKTNCQSIKTNCPSLKTDCLSLKMDCLSLKTNCLSLKTNCHSLNADCQPIRPDSPVPGG